MILFKRIIFRNFLSAGDRPVSIDLDDNKTTLIHGVNGSGKSTVLDAICYVLFNKPFRKINLPQLINTQNSKGLLTEVDFSIGKVNYTVSRGMKPKVFTITRDGKELESQAADRDNQKYLENIILKMNYKTFTQVVILGSSNFVPFMQLSGAGRRECVEDFLDIKVFSTMSILAKERLRGLKDAFRTVKGDISNLEYKIDLQKDRITEIEEHDANNVDELKGQIQSHMDEVQQLNEEIDKLQFRDLMLMASVNELLQSSPKEMHNQYHEVIIKMKSKLDSINKEGEFFKNNHECPSCSQVIDETIKNTILTQKIKESKKYSMAVIQAQSKLEDFNKILEEIQGLEIKIQDIHNQVNSKQVEVTSHNKSILTYETKLVNITSDSSALDREKGKIEVLEEQMSDLQKRNDSFINQIDEHEVIVSLLKDSGIKTLIVRKYLPVMNKFIRKYLSDLDYPIFFKLDEEFNESISSPLYQSYSYSSFSEGQKARIDLALMFTWREIGKLKNSVSTNILILDEVFSSSLDEVGKENLLSLLRYGLDDNQRIIVVDHTLSQSFKEKFDKNIEVKKLKGFSSYN